MFGELFREPDAALIMNLSRGQFYSLFLLLAGVLTVFFVRFLPNRLEGVIRLGILILKHPSYHLLAFPSLF